jgi:poly(A) polymerase
LDEAGLEASVRLRAGLTQLSAERVGAELRRILIAPAAGRAIDALYDYGLITGLLGGVARLADFARLIAIESALEREPNFALRLAVLAVFVSEDAARLGAHLRLTNAEQAILELGSEDVTGVRLLDESQAKAALYRLGPEGFATYVLTAWARSGASADHAGWRHALSLPDRWLAPVFPLRGGDIMALGDIQGPQIGEILRRLEQRWIAHGFAETRKELLERAAEFAKGLAPNE